MSENHTRTSPFRVSIFAALLQKLKLLLSKHSITVMNLIIFIMSLFWLRKLLFNPYKTLSICSIDRLVFDLISSSSNLGYTNGMLHRVAVLAIIFIFSLKLSFLSFIWSSFTVDAVLAQSIIWFCLVNLTLMLIHYFLCLVPFRCPGTAARSRSMFGRCTCRCFSGCSLWLGIFTDIETGLDIMVVLVRLNLSPTFVNLEQVLSSSLFCIYVY